MGALALTAPTLLTATHDLESFCCGVSSLDDWLKQRSLKNQVSGASRTYVVAAGQKVVGYYCLASGALALNEAPSSIRRNMPDPIPMALLGRLAVDQAWQHQKLGVALLQDAVVRAMQASEILGIRGLLVHAISPEAKGFYKYYGFTPSVTQPMVLILSLKKK